MVRFLVLLVFHSFSCQFLQKIFRRMGMNMSFYFIYFIMIKISLFWAHSYHCGIITLLLLLLSLLLSVLLLKYLFVLLLSPPPFSLSLPSTLALYLPPSTLFLLAITPITISLSLSLNFSRYDATQIRTLISTCTQAIHLTVYLAAPPSLYVKNIY